MNLVEILILLVFGVYIVHADLITVHPKSHRLVDEYRRERYFHGVNVVYKGTPYHPIVDHFDPFVSFSEEDSKYLASLGFNAIRLGVMWPGAQPTDPKSFNQTYIDLMKNIVNTMNKYGLYAILDCHQDLLSEKFCGEGAPAWAAIPNANNFPLPIDNPYTNNSEIPSPSDCNKHEWASYYFAEATATAFQNLYSNKNNVLDGFASFWNKIASEFKSFPNILGYELINEPFAGNIWSDPLLLVPGQADKKNLEPMYQVLNTAIRSVDNQHMIFFEPVTWDDFGVGFDSVPGGEDYSNRSVLSYHYYEPPDIGLFEAFTVRSEDMDKLHCGGFLTEFDMTGDMDDVIATMDVADLFLQSWTGWQFKKYWPITGWTYGLYNSSGGLNVELVKVMSRTYARAVAGHAVSMFYDTQSGDFELEYEMDPTCTQPTEIYLNEALNYPMGYKVTISPDVATWKRVAENIIHIMPATSSQPQSVQVVITKN